VSQYQKKQSPTHHPDHHPIFISFFHLPRSIASSLFKLRAWQFFCTTSLHALFGLPLGLATNMGRRTSSPLATNMGRQFFHLFNDLSARIITKNCHRRSCGTSTRICSLPGEMVRNTSKRTYDAFTRIHSTRAKDTGFTSAPIYSPCATDTGKQGELDLCRYLHIGIGLTTVHRCPQLLASLENSSAEL